MANLNTNIGPERVQVFDKPIGTVQVPGAAISSAAFLISSAKTGAPANIATNVFSMSELTTSFGDQNDIADDGYYAVQGFFDNAGEGAQAIIVNVGEGTKEVTSVTCVADSSGSLNSKFFRISSAYDRVKYYVWYDVNSAGVDPAAANSGRIGVKVSIATNATATQVATATAAALDALADFVSSSASAVVTVTNAKGGPATDAADGTAATGFTISVTTQGARPTASDYKGNQSAGTGLFALDVLDSLGMIAIPGLPLSSAYDVHQALISYSETVRAEFGATLSTSFSLLAPPKEITKANKDTLVLGSLTVASTTSTTIVFSGSPNLSSITPGMIVKKAGAYKTVITAVDDSTDTLTVVSTTGIAASDVLTVEIPSAITYKDSVINNPSRVAAWYFNNLVVSNATSGGADLTVDPTGHVAGIIARIDANRLIGAHSHAPAGIQYAGIAGIKGLSLSLSERIDAEPLRLAFINRITSFPGAGNVIFGGYTAGGNAVTADEQLIQVMRTIQFIKASLEPGLRGFLWENFSPETQAQVSNAVLSFLRNNAHLFPAQLPENQQFRVISVEPTQNELDQGLLRVRVQVRPNKAVRFIEVTLEYPIPATA
jgi:hypothetical protein